MRELKNGMYVKVSADCTKYKGELCGKFGYIKGYNSVDKFSNIPVEIINMWNYKSGKGLYWINEEDLIVIRKAEKSDWDDDNYDWIDGLESVPTKKSNNKVENNMKTEKILNLWRSNKEAELIKQRDVEVDELKSSDPNLKVLNEKSNEINNFIIAQKGEKMLKLDFYFDPYMTDETEKAINNVIQRTKEEIGSVLNKQYDEIKTMLSACETYIDEMRVLEAYDVVDDMGKLIS